MNEIDSIFFRTELLLGKNNMDILANSHILVFGLGGVGSFVVEGLARAGIGKITIVDNDCVDPTNLNRQLHATTSTIGRKKTELMRERILDINPNCVVTVIDEFYLPTNSYKFFDNKHYDYVVDAIDTLTAKIDIVLKCKKMNIPVISSMGTGNKLNPTCFEVADIYKTKVDPIARIMRKKLKEYGIEKLKVVYSTEKPRELLVTEKTDTINSDDEKLKVIGSISFVPSVVGLIIAGEVVRDLTGIINEVE